jgi:hypothetical protein
MPERVSAIHNVLTDVTGELVAHPTSAAKAHRSFISELERRELWYHTYLRTAITAGGFKRDANRVIPDVVAGNTETALLAETWLGFTGAIDPTHTWNAVSLGYVPHFKQSDYLEFCFYGIVRPEQKDLLTIERRFARNLAHSAVDLAVFNSHEPNEVLNRARSRAVAATSPLGNVASIWRILANFDKRSSPRPPRLIPLSNRPTTVSTGARCSSLMVSQKTSVNAK